MRTKVCIIRASDPYAVFFYLRYAVSYRDLEDIMAKRGVTVDHATLTRRVMVLPRSAAQAQARKPPPATSRRMDETYIKVKGKWAYLCRALDRNGQTFDFMLSDRCDLAAARRRAIANNGVPYRVVIDKVAADLAGLRVVNVFLKCSGNGETIGSQRAEYLNKIREQDHRFISRISRPVMGFKPFHPATAIIAGD